MKSPGETNNPTEICIPVRWRGFCVIKNILNWIFNFVNLVLPIRNKNSPPPKKKEGKKVSYMGKMKAQTTNHLRRKATNLINSLALSIIQVMQSFMTPAPGPRTLYAPRPFSGYPRQMPTHHSTRVVSFVGTPRILEQTLRKTSNEVLSLCFVDERLWWQVYSKIWWFWNLWVGIIVWILSLCHICMTN